MNRINKNGWLIVAGAGLLLLAASACSKRRTTPELVVEIPSGFSGNFMLEMGVRNAPPLVKQGDAYRVTVPKDGKLSTSTVLANPRTIFPNGSGSSVWGYSESVFTTGDGIVTGGKIEFFVGTQRDYEADQSKKNHSLEWPTPEESPGGTVRLEATESCGEDRGLRACAIPDVS